MNTTHLRFRQIHLDYYPSQHLEGIGPDFDPQEFAAALGRVRVDALPRSARCHNGCTHLDTDRFPERRHPHLGRELRREQNASCQARSPHLLRPSHLHPVQPKGAALVPTVVPLCPADPAAPAAGAAARSQHDPGRAQRAAGALALGAAPAAFHPRAPRSGSRVPEDAIALFDVGVSVRVEQPVRRVGCAPEGAPLGFAQEHGRVEFLLPRLEPIQVVVLDLG